VIVELGGITDVRARKLFDNFADLIQRQFPALCDPFCAVNDQRAQRILIQKRIEIHLKEFLESKRLERINGAMRILN
jgi:hypothetical protein